MTKARNIATTALMVGLWAIVITTFLLLIFGCETFDEHSHRRGGFIINADCAKNRVDVRFDLLQDARDQQIKIEPKP